MSGSVNAEKPCSRCHKAKPLSEFFRRPDRPGNRASACKECSRPQTAEAKTAAVSRTLRWKAQHPKEASESASRTKKKRRPHIRLVAREWASRNREKIRLWVRMANAARRSNGMRNPINLINRLMNLQRGKCAVCRCDIAKKFHLDHINPLSRGGPNVPSNTQLLCQPCNNSKYNKDPIEFMQSRGRLL